MIPKNQIMKRLLAIITMLMMGTNVFAQGPKVLVVTAHPDDETGFSVTMFKITKELKGTVDMAVMTDGGGGFADSQLGAIYFGLNLTDSIVARTHLPMIRKQEIINAGKIMGVRNIYFMEQPDDWYTTDITPYISGKNWNIPYVESRMDRLLAERGYDFVITMLPHPGQHGHHKTAAMMALRAVQRYKGPNKPIIIAGSPMREGMKPTEFSMLEGFPETRIKADAPKFTLNRAYRFAENDKLSYKIVADWVISEYKSQGAIQENGIHRTDMEIYHYYDMNDARGIPKVQKLFDDLAKSGFQPVVKK
jgi:LmbE family N-acetylglucosaminyl deacetylase